MFRRQVRHLSKLAPKGPRKANIGWIVGASLTAGALGGYLIAPKEQKGRKLATVATAGSVWSPENKEYKKQVGEQEDAHNYVAVDHKPKEAYQEVYNAIAKKIAEEDEYDDGIGYGPVLVRLAWHASGSYDKNDTSEKKGGNYGGTMHHKFEADDPGNNGLVNARIFLNDIQEKFPWISRGDLYSLAGVVAIQEMAGPKIAWRAGRKNLDEKHQPPHGRLPDASQGATHIREVFNRLSDFSEEEIVALIGVGHTIGKCHANFLGYDGPWTFSPNVVTNQFFDLLLNKEWRIRKWDGPTQFQDVETKSLMMLPTDFALAFDPKFKKICEVYAKDEKKLFDVFSKAFAKLLELGVKFPLSEKWIFKTLEEQEE